MKNYWMTLTFTIHPEGVTKFFYGNPSITFWDISLKKSVNLIMELEKKSLGFILWRPWMSVHFMATLKITVEMFHGTDRPTLLKTSKKKKVQACGNKDFRWEVSSDNPLLLFLCDLGAVRWVRTDRKLWALPLSRWNGNQTRQCKQKLWHETPVPQQNITTRVHYSLSPCVCAFALFAWMCVGLLMQSFNLCFAVIFV